MSSTGERIWCIPIARASSPAARVICRTSEGLKVLPCANAWGKMVQPFCNMPSMPSAEVSTGMPRRVLVFMYVCNARYITAQSKAGILISCVVPKLLPAKILSISSSLPDARFCNWSIFSCNVIRESRSSTRCCTGAEASLYKGIAPVADSDVAARAMEMVMRYFFMIICCCKVLLAGGMSLLAGETCRK